MYRRMIVLASTAALAGALALPASAGGSHGGGSGGGGSSAPAAAFSNVPSVLPSNVPSTGFEATSTSELGDAVNVASGSVNQTLKSVTVVLSSWACQSGTWSGGDCQTTPGTYFSLPMTLKLYNLNSGGGVGSQLVALTQLVTVPYRPSGDDGSHCNGDTTAWYNALDGQCYHGLATSVTFSFGAKNAVKLPASVIWTVAYNTTHSGYSPVGENTVCYGTVAGCPYDSLNVGDQTFPNTPSAGTYVDPTGAYQNSSWSGEYCDGGAAGVGSLRADSGCWTDFKPLVTIRTSSK